MCTQVIPPFYTPFHHIVIDPKIAGKKNKFASDYSTEQSYGDGTVPSWSSLMAPLKWSWEFDNGVENAKAIKTVEMCSQYNQKMTVYDGYEEGNGGYIGKNEYQGLMCECLIHHTLTGYPYAFFKKLVYL